MCRHDDNRRTIELPSQGPALGIFPDATLQDRQVTLMPGDVMLLYTDGLVNVRCNGRRQVNSRRFCGIIRDHQTLPAQQLVQALLTHTVANCDPTDDITVLVVKRGQEGEE